MDIVIALLSALKDYCQMRDRPELAAPAKDEVNEIRVSMGGKTVSQPKRCTGRSRAQR